MKWITREKVKVDRVACPWLIRKFVDKDAEFVFVPADKVMAEATRLDAIPYDVKDVELGHHGKECSFEAILKKYNLTDDPALVPFTVPLVAWGMLRALCLDERVVWFAWIAGLVLLARVRAMRRR